ncbi:MAG: nucleotidyl transferase AbiEii/AbiGii toxin family protein [Actinobacteria bacterium]|nr:nucleotidyl transferase AbiEii/AbiGii toxin family protein [Actinomycetota bacterium]
MSRPTRADAGGRAYLDLRNRARREGRPTQELLVLYALERFLARLSVSQHAGAFVLKGGMLLAAFDARRATVDADLLATGFPNDADAALSRVREVAGTEPADDDGVVFLPQTARARAIREENLYSGVRVTMQASIATATVKIQLDINFGDPVTPGPQLIDYPTLRDEHPPVRILGYPISTVIAEKLCTAIDLGDTSTRVRDYADIWTLTRRHHLDATDLRSAMTATARHRGVALRPLSDAVGDLATLRADVYKAFLTRVEDDTLALPPRLDHLLEDVIAFADPLINDQLVGTWSATVRLWNAGTE